MQVKIIEKEATDTNWFHPAALYEVGCKIYILKILNQLYSIMPRKSSNFLKINHMIFIPWLCNGF